MMSSRLFAVLLSCVLATTASAATVGYYRQPTLHGDTIVFVSEGDLWQVKTTGGVASRLTSHAGEEALPALSPDGQTLAFVASYEGQVDLYTMPLAGGRPERRTFGAGNISFVGWTPAGKILYATQRYSGLPSTQLVTIDPRTNHAQPVPLVQAADGTQDEQGKALYFTRLPFQGSHTRRYRGGTAQNLWKFVQGGAEATPLTADYPGTSKQPLWWQGRVYFVSDRDGTMNLWSMNPTGGDLKQHTRHSGWDVSGTTLQNGRIVYQLGADLCLLDLVTGQDRKLEITLASDLDQTRERWVEKPLDWLSAAHISPDGSKVALTARGRIFVAPVKKGRLVEVTHKADARQRGARFLPDGKTLLAFSDASGEVELWRFPANGVGVNTQLTRDGEVLRSAAVPSPDGKWIAHTDKNQRLFIYDVEKKTNRQIDTGKTDELDDLTWSPDSQWLAYAETGNNIFRRIKIFSIQERQSLYATTDRYDSFAPAWSTDGKWLYFLSDRHLKSIVPSPWGTYQPEPYLDKKTRIYQLALGEGEHSPFEPPDETTETPEKKKDDKGKAKPPTVTVKIARAGLEQRLQMVPVAPGNYRALHVNEKSLFWLQSATGEMKANLAGIAISSDGPEVKVLAADVSSFELSQDGKKLLIRKKTGLHVVEATPAAADLSKGSVDLSAWSLSVVPRAEWRQMFLEAWRLERDYFYDRGMHGIDWKGMLKKYQPLVERVHSRAELSDLIGQLVSELSALHIFVRGGDTREGPEKVTSATLGAVLERAEEAGGFRVAHIYRHDPDEPDLASPLARPGVNIHVEDVIEMINGKPTLQVPEIGDLLRNQAGKQVLLRVKPARGQESRTVIVRPLKLDQDANLRYHEWEYTRRLRVEEQSNKEIGYVHLRAMGTANYSEWARDYYPAYRRPGLIIDVRHNRGGNIDSWILGRLLRKAWFHWNQRVGESPFWNMQYAFRGHIVVLCNEYTASDGEAFCEGIKRLKLGTVVGTRTWGGEIWLRANNFLVDKGIATSAEFGVYGPEGVWLIEGQGVEPDIVVDNLPHATFKGEDAQLEAAIRLLQKKIKEQPVTLPPVPAFPNKLFPPPRKIDKGSSRLESGWRKGESAAVWWHVSNLSECAQAGSLSHGGRRTGCQPVHVRTGWRPVPRKS